MRALTNLRRNRIMAKADLTAARLRELFDYNPETGILVRKANSRRTDLIGKPVLGKPMVDGHLQVAVDGKRYLAHRLAWLHFYGRWPDAVIDHINGNPADNRIANLRDVSQAVNSQNRNGAQSNNKVGALGVNKIPSGYRARIKPRGAKAINLGVFRTLEEAQEAYRYAKQLVHEGARPLLPS